MSLRRDKLIIVGIILILSILSTYLVLYATISSRFDEMERGYVIDSCERVKTILNNKLSNLDSTCYDWAAWDDTYQFVQDGNQRYIDANLVDSTFTALKINLMIFVNTSGKIVYAKAYDLEKNEEVDVPKGIYRHLDYLSSFKDVEDSITGILGLDKPMLIASRPILTSNDEGPIKGALIMGKYLDEGEINLISAITRTKVTIVKSNSTENVIPIDENRIAGLVPLRDVYGNYVCTLKVEMPRELHKQGIEVIREILILVGIVGVVFSTAALLFLDKSVLSRLHVLIGGIAKIRETGDLRTKVEVKGSDELAKLGEEINAMLNEIQESYTKIENLNNSLRLINKIMRHDILNDLTVIDAYLQLYRESGDKKAIDKALKTIERSVRLINRMRELEELTAARELKPINVGDVVKEVLKNYTIDFSIKGNCTVKADEALMVVIDNIVRNAIMHGKTDKIEVTIKRTDGLCEIRIADYGNGIPDEIKDKLFDEGFYYGETGHTGLGLYIAKRVVEGYGGSISVEDNKPKGAVFVVKLECY